MSKLELRIQRLERQVNGLESDITKSAIQLEKKEEPLGFKDSIWACRKCGFRLGIYDSSKDTLRVRYKDFYAWWKPGKGGALKLICRGCSEINDVNYIDEKI